VPVDHAAIRPGDVVLVSQRGRTFHATVRGRGVGGLVIEPHDRSVRARRVAPAELVDHWFHAERAEPGLDGQLVLDVLDE
jgi:hypothetical protein